MPGMTLDELTPAAPAGVRILPIGPAGTAALWQLDLDRMGVPAATAWLIEALSALGDGEVVFSLGYTESGDVQLPWRHRSRVPSALAAGRLAEAGDCVAWLTNWAWSTTGDGGDIDRAKGRPVQVTVNVRVPDRSAED
jgi:hypothetical protein